MKLTPHFKVDIMKKTKNFSISKKATINSCPDLPEPIQKRRNIELVEVPFEATRITIIELYLTILAKQITNQAINNIPNNELIAHYLFIKSLINDEPMLSQYFTNKTINQLESHLINKIPLKKWNDVKNNCLNSEYPIIEWLNNHDCVNFISKLIFKFSSKDLTHNQKHFLSSFSQSAVFYFPDRMYQSWLTKSFRNDSLFKPKKNSSFGSESYHSKLTDNLLMRSLHNQITSHAHNFYALDFDTPPSSLEIELSKLRFKSLLGRTMLFSIDGEDELIAIKVQKKGELKSDLAKEFNMGFYLNQNKQRLGLKSKLPTPLAQYSVPLNVVLNCIDDSVDSATFRALIIEDKTIEIYAYKASEDYFTYLHEKDQTLEELNQAVKTNVHDLFMLLRDGIVFPQLADLFHTQYNKEARSDKGRYQTLVQLLRDNQFDMGRIDKWKKAVEFINLRRSGLADLGDSMPLIDLLNPSDFTQNYYTELLTGGFHQTYINRDTGKAHSLFTNKRNNFGNYLHINIIAEYLLVVQLAIGYYANKVNHSMSEKDQQELWQELSLLMFDCCAEVINIMTGMPHNRALTHLNQRVNYHTHALQTQFWMTPDYSQLNKLTFNQKQKELYPDEQGYEICSKMIANVGLSEDGINQDLGDYNSTNPLRELEKLLFATVTLLEGNQQLDTHFLNQLEIIDNLLESDADAGECYQATAKLLELARPGARFQQQLALSYFATIKQKYPDTDYCDSRFQQTHKELAALKILNFWRTHKQSRNDDSKIHDIAPPKLP
jgi:hypothetical protein